MNLCNSRHKAVQRLTLLGTVVVFLSLVLTSGCGSLLYNQRHKGETDFTVIPFSNSSVLALSGDDVRLIMEKAGFTPPQIWELGLEVHNGLKQVGGVKIRVGKKHIEAVFAVQGYHVWIQTSTRGLFVYDVRSKQFNLGPGTQSGPYAGGLAPNA